MNNSLKNCDKVLALATPRYFSDAAAYSEMERNAALAIDPTGEKGKVVIVEIAPCKYDPLFSPLSHVRETSGLQPNEAADALLIALGF